MMTVRGLLGAVFGVALAAVPAVAPAGGYVDVENRSKRPVCFIVVGRGMRCVETETLRGLDLRGLIVRDVTLQLSIECMASPRGVVLGCERHCWVAPGAVLDGYLTVHPDYRVTRRTRAGDEVGLCPPDDDDGR